MSKKLLLVDDDVKLAELVGDYLTPFGFTVAAATTPSAAQALLTDNSYDIAILDIMLPEMDGFELCKIIRQKHPHLPIIMLTARDSVTDRVVGLEIGADDYLPKPFDPRELLARLTALLRRALPDAGNATNAETTLAFDGLTVDLRTRRVWLDDGGETPLTAMEFRLLAELIKECPAIVTRDHLIEKLRGFERDVYDRSVDISISRLRQKLRDNPAQPRFIQTRRGVGYAFIAAQK